MALVYTSKPRSFSTWPLCDVLILVTVGSISNPSGTGTLSLLHHYWSGRFQPGCFQAGLSTLLQVCCDTGPHCHLPTADKCQDWAQRMQLVAPLLIYQKHCEAFF